MEVTVKQLLVINKQLNAVKCVMTNATVKLIGIKELELIIQRNKDFKKEWFCIETGEYVTNPNLIEIERFEATGTNGKSYIASYKW